MTPLALAQESVTGIPGPDLMPSLWQTTGATLVVLALLAVLVWVLKRGALVTRGKGGLVVESALPLGDRRSLAIVAVENRRLLLGLSPGQVSLITELDARPSFDQTLSRASSDAVPS